MHSTNIRKSNKPYYDDVNFPQGFSRSGDFSLLESDLMTEYGHTMKGLQDGILIPENEEEQQFIDAITGAKEPLSKLEKTWSKYLNCSNPKSRQTLSSKTHVQSNDESSQSRTGIEA